MPCERNELSHYTCTNIHEQHQGHAKHDRVSPSQQRPARCVTSPGITAHGRDASRAAVWHVGRRVDEYCLWWSSSKKLASWHFQYTFTYVAFNEGQRKYFTVWSYFFLLKWRLWILLFLLLITWHRRVLQQRGRSQDDKSKGLRDDWLGGKRFSAFLKAENRTRHAAHSNK